MSDIFRDEYLQAQLRLERIDAIMRNKHLSASDKCILIIVDKLYPTIVRDRVPIQVWRIAKESGSSPRSVSCFFQAMRARGYVDYQVERKQDATGQYSSECSVQALEAWNRPSELNTRDTPKRKEHRRKVKERLQCRVCGSADIEIFVVARCRNCGRELYEEHKHELD